MDNNDKPGSKMSLREKAAAQGGEYIRQELRKVDRARTRLMVCFLTLPVYAVAVWVLLSNGHAIDTFMYIYMAMWLGFGVDIAIRRCPACGKQFYVKTVILNLITRNCVHCGIDARNGKAETSGSGGDDDDNITA